MPCTELGATQLLVFVQYVTTALLCSEWTHCPRMDFFPATSTIAVNRMLSLSWRRNPPPSPSSPASSPSPSNHKATFVSTGVLLHTKCTREERGSLWVTSFSLHSAFKMCSWNHMNLCFVLFHDHIIVRCIDIPNFVYTFLSWGCLSYLHSFSHHCQSCFPEHLMHLSSHSHGFCSIWAPAQQ